MKYYKKNIDKYRRTIGGFASQVRASQSFNSKARGHQPPSYTMQELREWLSKSELFLSLFKQWRDSGYQKSMKPSLDRIDESVGYSFSNVQIVTIEQNYKNSWAKNKRGEYCNISKRVGQLSLDGEILKEYVSTMEAHREGGYNQAHVASVCRQERKTHGGFKWKYLT